MRDAIQCHDTTWTFHSSLLNGTHFNESDGTTGDPDDVDIAHDNDHWSRNVHGQANVVAGTLQTFLSKFV